MAEASTDAEVIEASLEDPREFGALFDRHFLKADPFELQNVASDPNYASVKTDMYTRMVQLCQPPPAGFVP
ncbi:MAG: hypothetical protein M3O84_04840 [Actinomycetota bacterium]|nr:hypothetical protein [Actinomycetota bacterium]